MEAGNLQNASTYLNNLLLARGLLRNGKSIEFASPRRGAGGTDDTMATVINLVHDLIIRRDREAEQRETLAINIRNLRAEETQRTGEMEQLKNKNAELVRNMALAEGQSRSLEAAARKAEASARELKGQMAKMKSALDQVRAKCVNEIRKRDIELEKLRKHIGGMQRGAQHSSGMKMVQGNSQPPLPRNRREFRSGMPAIDENWSLEKETNDILAALVNETGTENVTLRHIVEETIEILKELTGLHEEPEKLLVDPEIGVPGQYKQSRVNAQSSEQEALVPCDELAQQMDAVIGHCRAILKDPSFVSIEEVQIREEEIIKLREGWEKMAGRWKDAVAMIDTWRKRMHEGGNTVDLDELSTLDFGKSLAALPSLQADVPEEDLSRAIFDDDAEDHPEMGEDSGHHHDESGCDSTDNDAQPPPLKRLASSPARRGIRLPRPIAAFHEIDANVQRRPPESSRSTFTSSSEYSAIGSLDGSIDSEVHLGLESSSVPSKAGKGGPPLSVAQKLAIIEAEAKEAEEIREKHGVTSKRKASRRVPLKRGRRRSTLSPEELAQLMGVR